MELCMFTFKFFSKIKYPDIDTGIIWKKYIQGLIV